MGERDLSSTALPVAALRRRIWGPAVLLLALSSALAMARPAEAPSSARGVSYVLAAQSLAGDLDLRLGEDDLARLRALPQADPMRLLLAGREAPAPGAFPIPVPLAALAAPFAAVAGVRGVVLANLLFLVVAMAMAARTLRQRLDTPWRLLVAFLFGSVVTPFLFEPRPEGLVLAAVVAAFALAYRSETPTFDEMPEVFDRPYTLADPRLAGRWLAVGLLLGIAVLLHPLHLALLVPAAMALPGAARRSGRVLLGVGLVAMLGLGLGGALVLDAAMPWITPLGIFESGELPVGQGAGAASDPVPSVLEAARPVADVALTGWNALFFAAGRTVGALPYFLPVVLILALWEPGARRSTLVVTAIATGLVAVAVWPFDFAGDARLGNAWWLPVYGSLWLVPTRRVGMAAPLAVMALSGLILWPSWLGLVGLRSEASPTPGGLSPLASRWLPAESTLRPVGRDFLEQDGVRVLLAGGALSERGGRLFLSGGHWGNLVVASPRPVDRLFLAFDGQAGSELEVVGGELGNTLFQGDGGVGFEILLEESARRHPMWWSDSRQTLYDLRVRLPRAPAIPIAFRLGLGARR